jgi:hypothetical protein
MGTSYEGLVVVGDQSVVVDALTDAGLAALVIEAAPGRVAVIPKEDARWGVADVVTVATLLSGRHGLAVLVHDLYDSEVLTLRIYEHGVVTHEYVSEMRHVGHVEETGEGFFRVVDGTSYRLDDPAAPSGPRGADPDRLTAFGVGAIDRDRLGRLLVSADQYVFANEMHAEVIKALNLDPIPLTTAYRWVERGEVELAGAVRVTSRA